MENWEELLLCKKNTGAPPILSANNISALDCMYTRRLNELLTKDFVKLMIL